METCWVSVTVVNSKKVWNLSVTGTQRAGQFFQHRPGWGATRTVEMSKDHHNLSQHELLFPENNI